MQNQNSPTFEEHKQISADGPEDKAKSSGSNQSDQLFKTPQDLSEHEIKESNSKESEEDKIEKPNTEKQDPN